MCLILIGAFILAGSVIGSSLLARRDRMTGQTVPDFTLIDTGGERISLKDYRGNIVLLHYGPTW